MLAWDHRFDKRVCQQPVSLRLASYSGRTSDWVSALLALTAAWLAGENVPRRRARWAALEERALLLERERDERDRAAASAERLRKARELHDVVAHAMSVIAVQAGIGHHVSTRMSLKLGER